MVASSAAPPARPIHWPPRPLARIVTGCREPETPPPFSASCIRLVRSATETTPVSIKREAHTSLYCLPVRTDLAQKGRFCELSTALMSILQLMTRRIFIPAEFCSLQSLAGPNISIFPDFQFDPRFCFVSFFGILTGYVSGFRHCQ